MRRIVERKTFSGAVCEIEEYPISDKVINVEKAEPHPRFKSEEERKRHRDGISRRNHVRRFNRNFSPSSLYVTLTFDDKHYVNNFPDARRIEDNYYRCVKRRCPDAKIMMYMGRGRKTGRIHFHMVCDGVPGPLYASSTCARITIIMVLTMVRIIRDWPITCSPTGQKSKADTAGSSRETCAGQTRKLPRSSSVCKGLLGRRRAICLLRVRTQNGDTFTSSMSAFRRENRKNKDK